MPLFTVTWTKSVEWTVEAESLEDVENAAKNLPESELWWEDSEIDVHEIPSKIASKMTIDAVEFNGTLLNPEDARKAKMADLATELLERPTLRCPQCEAAADASLFNSKPYLRCPKCVHIFSLKEMENLLNPTQPPDEKTIDMFEGE